MKYLQVFKTSWENGFVYRLNFVMWRVRSVMRLLLVYFLWSAVFSQNERIFDYSKAAMLTYVLGTSVLQALVLGSRSVDVGGEISSGDLSNYLLKPINYLRYWLSRDLADKVLNISFVVAELGLIVLLFKPALVAPPTLMAFFGGIVAAFLAMVLYFYLSFLISATAFWYPEHNGWPARFLFQVLMEFVAGGIFPLDILPAGVFALVRFLPTSFLLFFPLQVWLGRVEGLEVWGGIGFLLVWIFVLKKIVALVWQRGLKAYEAYGK